MGWYGIDTADDDAREWDTFVAYCEARGMSPDDPYALHWYDAYNADRRDSQDFGGMREWYE